MMSASKQPHRRLRRGVLQWFAGSIVLTILLSILYQQLLKPEPEPLADAEPPVWRGIVPGRTNQQEVLALIGEPESRSRCSSIAELHPDPFIDFINCLFGPLTFEYVELSATGVPYHHYVTFRNGRVWLIEENIVFRADTTEPSVATLVGRLGLPEDVTWSITANNALLYCKQGLIAHADLRRVEVMNYFPPMQTEDCIATFKSVRLEDPHPGWDVIRVKDPWGYTDPNRKATVSLLGLEVNATWEDIEYYMDCEFIRPNMRYDEVVEQLSTIDSRARMQMQNVSHPQINVAFEGFPFAIRVYAFEDDRLVLIQEPSPDGSHLTPVRFTGRCIP